MNPGSPGSGVEPDVHVQFSGQKLRVLCVLRCGVINFSTNTIQVYNIVLNFWDKLLNAC